VAISDAELDRIIAEEIAPRAVEIDRSGAFPKETIAALSKSGYLGLTSSKDVGGSGGGLRDAASVIEAVASVCGSSAMVLLMHYAATAIVEAHGSDESRREIASGRNLSTLAFSEVGSRSHFWAPQSTATLVGGDVQLDATKSWVTSANEADSYVWSSLPYTNEGPMTLWLVPSTSSGLTPSANFDGFGLRGNGSVPVTGEGVTVPLSAMLGDDGSGLDIALAVALPWFLVLSGAFSLGIMESVVAKTGEHLSSARLEHIGQTLIEQPVLRRDFAQMRLTTDTVRALLNDTLNALESERADAMLRVLEIKAAAGEAAITVTELAMKLCGGSAFRKEVGIERHFRDARASRVMAPTTDALLDFIGRAVGGLPLLG
jgi:isovaleryl-CoA dehydrogenase